MSVPVPAKVTEFADAGTALQAFTAVWSVHEHPKEVVAV
jgi:hypothetical protein